MEQFLKDLVSSYELGFISATEFVNKYVDMLRAMGAGDELVKVQDALCEPLARFLIGIARGSGDQIKGFSFHLVAQNNITKKGIEDLSFNEN